MMSLNLLVCALLLVACTSAIPKPKYMKICHTKDPDFEKCAVKAAQDLINNIPHGDRKYGIPDLKPMTLPLVNIDEGNFKLGFTNLELHGIDQLIIKDIKIKDKKMVVTGHFELLEFIGPYTASGKILILPIEGKGQSHISAHNIDLTYTCSWENYEENGETFAKLIDSGLNYKMKKTHFKFENLFNGDKKLGDHVNTFMNENWEEVVKDLNPSVNKIILNIINSIVSSFYKRISQEEIYPE